MTSLKPTIILVKPQLPENIGLTARAMQNCGLDKLILISPRDKWPNNKAMKASTNAKNIIKNAVVFDSIDKAVTKFNYLIATSSRKRFLKKTHKNDFSKLFDGIGIKNKTAILFGSEQSGLSNEDLMLCDCIFSIPASLNNISFNLSHAVLLMAYKWRELSNKFVSKKIKEEPLDKKNLILFLNYLRKQLSNSGFLYPEEKSNSMFNNIQSMFIRAKLSKKEIQTLWGMIRTLKKPKKR